MNSQTDDEVEVNCYCDKCFGEGTTFVSSIRAKELREKEIVEDACPYGDRCVGDDDDIACCDCDYTISQGEFDSGKGRIMFNDVNEEGSEYRCGCCDDRVTDPMGMSPDIDSDDDDED